ncbi:MAG TPA: FG-GAP-like repeat-containing protein, partial [Acidobacteriota bacterium]|nr:FG-GAP-like repeat-containing protein [Acidobacteriota bacterium]
MTRVSAILAAVLLAAAWVGAGINCWSTSGPYGGETSFIVIDPQTPNVLFARQNGGGFFRSRNWGQSWEYLPGFGWPNTASSCLVHPADHRIVLVGTSGTVGGGMTRSEDGGDTWQKIPLPGYTGGSSIIRIIAHPEQPNIIYAAAGAGYDGLFVSADWGKSWSQIRTFEDLFFNDFEMSLTPPYAMFYALRWKYDPDTGQQIAQGIIRSTDGGLTWYQSMPPIGSAYRLISHPDRPGWIYASVNINSLRHIYRSTDGGDSWHLLVSKVGFDDMAFHPTRPDWIYLADSASCFFSPDSGQTLEPLYLMGGTSVALDRSSEGGALYFGSYNGIVRSWNGGTSFRPASFGILDDVWAMAVSPSEPGTLLAGDMRGFVYRSQDGGLSWKLLGQILPWMVNALALNPATDPDTILAAANYRVWLSADDGVSWGAKTSWDFIFDIKGDPFDPSRFYASSGNSMDCYPSRDNFDGIFWSTDGGTTWTATGQLDNLNIIELLVDPAEPQRVFASGHGGVYRSTDYGMTWGLASGGLVNNHALAMAMDAGPPPVLYAGISHDMGSMVGSGVYRSDNFGDSWIYAGLFDIETSALAFDPTARILYAGTRYHGLLESEDGGVTWQLTTPLLGANTVFHDVLTDCRGLHNIYAATNTGVYNRIELQTPAVVVEARSTQTGIVNPKLTNQVLPAAAVTLLFSNNPFPAASTANPVILELQLPAGATLSQTLATGRLTDLTLQPAGRTVLPLAVSEYAWDPSPAVHMPRAGGSAGAIPNPAVQLFRCVEGEDRIWLRLLRSTNTWVPSDPEYALGVTIGTGAGVWPPTAGSNWGAAGVFRQENTQFFGDIRGYDFAAHKGALTLTLRAFYQKSRADTGAVFTPAAVDLFRLDLDWPDTFWTASLLGAVITDWGAADLDGDGREDVVSVDGALGRLYWSLGRSDGTFAPPQWRALDGDAPVTVEVADATGDGRPEILVADAGGHLTVYDWADVTDKAAAPEQAPAPRQRTILAGVASASLVYDVTGDGFKDFLYTDAAAGTLTVLPGTTFAVPAIYPAGAHPLALAAGDFDGNTDADIAVANRDSRSVTVFLNAGGAFIGTEYNAAGTPAALAAADFNRDGRADLAMALTDPKTVSIWRAGAGGAFDTGQGQRIYFLNIPS